MVLHPCIIFLPALARVAKPKYIHLLATAKTSQFTVSKLVFSPWSRGVEATEWMILEAAVGRALEVVVIFTERVISLAARYRCEINATHVAQSGQLPFQGRFRPDRPDEFRGQTGSPSFSGNSTNTVTAHPLSGSTVQMPEPYEGRHTGEQAPNRNFVYDNEFKS